LASSINASTTAGVVTTADTSGVLNIQTAGTTAITVDASQNVGIGTTTPSFPSGTGLAIFNTSVPRIKLSNSTTGDTSTDGTNLLVSGSDFYIQQREAASVFISTNGTNAVTVDSGGGFKVLNTIGVGNATPSTSGAGITFPATQSASTDANTLDDYEEGTWTPVIKLGTTTQTVTSSSGRYTKIGRQVTVYAEIYGITKSGTGTLTVTGLPFSNTGGLYGLPGDTRWANINPSGKITALVNVSDTTIGFQNMSTTSGYTGPTDDSHITTNYALYDVSATYFV
jgi:hypothetical protein